MVGGPNPLAPTNPLVYQGAWRLERSRTMALDATIAKLFVSESLVEALGAVQIRGGYGFMTEYEAERALRDARRQHGLFGHLRRSRLVRDLRPSRAPASGSAKGPRPLA